MGEGEGPWILKIFVITKIKINVRVNNLIFRN